MIDIGERLRSVDPLSTEGIDWTLLKDAADEIDTLRKLVNLYREENTQQATEIERLRVALDIAVKVQREVQDEKERLREKIENLEAIMVDCAAQIERLRAKLSLAETAITQFDLDAKEAAAEIERLREHHALNLGWEKRAREAEAEIERLRVALKAIAENDYQELTPEDFASVALNLLCKGLARRR